MKLWSYIIHFEQRRNTEIFQNSFIRNHLQSRRNINQAPRFKIGFPFLGLSLYRKLDTVQRKVGRGFVILRKATEDRAIWRAAKAFLLKRLLWI